jgi:hypothetical protein
MVRTPWIRLDARIGEDPRFVDLPSDSARVAWILTLGKAKQNRPQGIFDSPQHLAASLGKYGRYVPALLAVGLLRTLEDGRIGLPRWADWQTDLDYSTPRTARLRALKRNETA